MGIYTDPLHVMAYDDGEVRQEFAVCFHARYVSGQPREDGTETKAARWVEPADVAGLSIHPSMRRRIEAALREGAEPEIVLDAVARRCCVRSIGMNAEPPRSSTVRITVARSSALLVATFAAQTGQTRTDPHVVRPP